MPDGRYSKISVETDPNMLSEKQITDSFRPGVRIPWVVVTTLITAFASTIGTYYATHSTPVDCASHGEVNALDKRVSELDQTLRALNQAVISDSDRAHNDIEILKSELAVFSRQK